MIVDSIEDDQSNNHSASISVLASELLQRNGISTSGLTAVSLNIGPGSFTSLRVGLSFAKAVCFVNEIPIIAMSSFDIMVNSFLGLKNKAYLPLIKARKEEAYFTLINQDGEIIKEPAYINWNSKGFRELIEAYQPFIIVDQDLFEDSLFTQGGVVSSVSATQMTDMTWSRYLANSLDNIYTLKPLYIKPPHITVSKKVRSF